MTDKQAAAVLREIVDHPGLPAWHKSAERGADAIEMLEWLFTPGRWSAIYSRYLKCDVPGNFRAFCEAKFEEYKKEPMK